MTAYAKKFLLSLLVTGGLAFGAVFLGAMWAVYLYGIHGFVWIRERSFFILFTAAVAAAGAANEWTFRTSTRGDCNEH